MKVSYTSYMKKESTILEKAISDYYKGIDILNPDGIYKDYNEQYTHLITELNSHNIFKKGMSYHVGSKKFPISPYWSQYNHNISEPKTDIVITDKRISIKFGISQFMSGNPKEAIATLRFASLKSKNNNKTNKQIDYIEHQLEKIPGGIADNNVTTMLSLGTDEVLNQAEKSKQEITLELNEFLSDNKTFKREFIRESASGFGKFSMSLDNNDLKNIATSDYLMTVSKNYKVVHIGDVNDNDFIDYLIDASRVICKFKSNSQKKNGRRTGKYIYRLVIGVMFDNIDENTLKIKS